LTTCSERYTLSTYMQAIAIYFFSGRLSLSGG
jgi:hypothetical protein